MNITIVIDILFKDVCNMYSVHCILYSTIQEKEESDVWERRGAGKGEEEEVIRRGRKGGNQGRNTV